jgi:putative transposase
MSQSLAKNTIHLVFSTKDRHLWLNEALRPRVYAYLAGIFEQCESPALLIGGAEDHVHSLFLLSKNHPLKKIVEEIKKGSSIWIKPHGEGLADFAWQGGYGAFSVSESNVPEVKKYIERQAEHHRTMTFQDELRQLLARHGIAGDERYLWS